MSAHQTPRPDDMVLRRSAFDFLLKRGVVTDKVFTGEEANAKVVPIKITSRLGRNEESDGTAIHFYHSFDSDVETIKLYIDQDCIVFGYLNGEENFTFCEEKLNIAERMDALAFPVDSNSPLQVTAPAKKRARIAEQPNMIDSIADTTVLHILSFAVSMRDIMPVMRVCKRWHRLVNETEAADQEVWKLLCGEYYPVLIKVKEATTSTVTWKELFFERARHLRALLRPEELVEETIDRHQGDPFGEDGIFQPVGFQSHSFSIQVHKTDGISTTVQATLEHFSPGILQLKLVSAASLSECTSLDIMVNESMCLYSGSATRHSRQQTKFTSFNQFEKFRAKSFLVELCPDSLDGEGIGIPIVSPVFHVGESSLFVHIAWQTNTGGRSLVPMTEEDMLVFLQKGLSTMPGIRMEEQENWSLSKHEPRPFSSYLFLVDYLIYTEEPFPCVRDIKSCLYEPRDCIVNFTIPSGPEEGEILPRFKFDASGFYTSHETEMVIYAIDMCTGMHAKLFQGSICGSVSTNEGHGDALGDYDHFNEFSVLTFFAGRTLRELLTTYAIVYGLEDDASTNEFVVELSWKRRETQDTVSYKSFGEAEFLTFLEKGLRWGEPISGNHRAFL